MTRTQPRRLEPKFLPLRLRSLSSTKEQVTKWSKDHKPNVHVKLTMSRFHIPQKTRSKQNKCKHEPRAQLERKKNIAQTKTYKKALMTNNEVDSESLPLSPLKYFKHSRSSLHLYVDFARVHNPSVSSWRTRTKNVKQKSKKRKPQRRDVGKRENKSENVQTSFQTMTKMKRHDKYVVNR